jgi:hypothetical protein
LLHQPINAKAELQKLERLAKQVRNSHVSQCIKYGRNSRHHGYSSININQGGAHAIVARQNDVSSQAVSCGKHLFYLSNSICLFSLSLPLGV